MIKKRNRNMFRFLFIFCFFLLFLSVSSTVCQKDSFHKIHFPQFQKSHPCRFHLITLNCFSYVCSPHIYIVGGAIENFTKNFKLFHINQVRKIPLVGCR